MTDMNEVNAHLIEAKNSSRAGDQAASEGIDDILALKARLGEVTDALAALGSLIPSALDSDDGPLKDIRGKAVGAEKAYDSAKRAAMRTGESA